MDGTERRVAVLADTDSRWKWGAAVARSIAPGHRLEASFLRGRTAPTDRQLAEIGVIPDRSRLVTPADLVDDQELATADLVVFATAGGLTSSLLYSLGRAWEALPQRPVTVVGYVGVVYEKLIEGLLNRAGADIVLANSAFDTQRFREVFTALGIDPNRVVEAALPFLGGAPYDCSVTGRDRPFTLCFAAQPSVPKSRNERVYLLERAVAHARQHPDRQVLIKLRAAQDERTTHAEAHPYPELTGHLTAPPPENLRMIYGNMGEVLDHTDLLVTVSSTAALESAHRGIPTAVLTDLGVRQAYGSHFFIKSGCLASWDDLDAGRVPAVDPAWAAMHGLRQPDPYRAARARVAELRAGRQAPIRPYYSLSNAYGYVTTLLHRYGLDEKGRPLPPDHQLWGQQFGQRDGLLRRVIRRGARATYRVGLERVAPAIRRYGGL